MIQTLQIPEKALTSYGKEWIQKKMINLKEDNSRFLVRPDSDGHGYNLYVTEDYKAEEALEDSEITSTKEVLESLEKNPS